MTDVPYMQQCDCCDPTCPVGHGQDGCTAQWAERMADENDAHVCASCGTFARRPATCRDCGAPMRRDLDAAGVSHHVDPHDMETIDYNADGDHVAVAEE